MLIFLQMYLGPPGLEVTSHWEHRNEKEEAGASVAELPSADPKVGTPVQSTSPLGLSGPSYVNIMGRLWSHPTEAPF